jgi:hypothetical protein
MMTRLSSALLLALALAVATPAAFAFADATEKAQDDSKQRRRNRDRERGEPFLPSAVGSDFAGLDANNPFALEAYSVRWSPTGIDSVDTFLGAVTRVEGILALSQYYADMVSNGDSAIETIGALNALRGLLTSLPNDITGLQQQGQQMIANLPNELAADPRLALRAGGIINGVRDAVSSLGGAAGRIDNVIASVDNVIAGTAGTVVDTVTDPAEAVETIQEIHQDGVPEAPTN